MGRVTIVLLPGMDGTGLLLENFVVALGQEFESIVVRYPTDEPLGYSALERIAEDHLPKDRSFILLGESFSGPIAINLAAKAPAGLRGLVLCCSFARTPRPGFSWLRTFSGLVPFAWVPQWLLDYSLLGKERTAKLSAQMKEAIAHVRSSVMRGRLREVLEVDVSNELRRVTVPVLYLQALEDRAVPSSAANLVTSLVPSARVERLTAPHFLLQTRPLEAANIIRRFAADGTKEQQAAGP